jgi:putative ABC transport system substrate-binding protein
LLVIGALLMVVLAGLTFKQSGGIEDKHYVIGIVNPSKGMREATRGFIEGMRERGYKEGENVTYLKWEQRPGIDTAIADMMGKGVDLFYTVTTPPTVLAKKATADSGTPVVFTMYDPVKSNVIDSMMEPGGNLTGVQVSGSITRGLDWLRTVVPSAKNVFVPVKYDTMAARQSLNELMMHADRLGMRFIVEEVQDADELGRVLDSMSSDVDAVFMPHSILLTANSGLVMDISTAKKIPVLAAHRKKNATLSFGHNEYKTGVQASRMAHVLLLGESPANIPSEMADFFVTINLQHAEAVGINVGNDVLLQADEIVR